MSVFYLKKSISSFFKSKNTLLILAMLFLFCGILRADEFDEAANVVSNASNSGKAILGTAMQWIFSVILFFGSMAVGMFLGYKYQSKKSEQDQSTMKLFGVMGVCGILGFFVYNIILMLFSRALLGDFTKLLSRVYEFWGSIL